MRTFNCDANLGLIRDDYGQVCPSYDSYLFIYSACFFLLYPIGIPFFMNSAMMYMGMRGIAREKMQAAEFRSMLALFMKRATSLESQRMARLVGNVDDDEELFLAQSREQYDKLLSLQGQDDLDVLIVEKLRSKANTDHGMEGLSVEELVIVCRVQYMNLRMPPGVSVLKRQSMECRLTRLLNISADSSLNSTKMLMARSVWKNFVS